MLRLRPLLGLSVLAFGFIGGCSLTSIVDVNPGECSGATAEGDRACQEALDPGNPDCSRYKCVDNGDFFQCQEVGGDGGGEVCDGLDNDCDGLVDEANGRDPVISVEATRLVSTGSPLNRVAVTDGAFGQVAYLQQADAGLDALDLSGESSARQTVITMTQPPNAGNNAEKRALTEGCYGALGSTEVGSCTVNAAAVDTVQDAGFFAFINTSGCSAGELRVGIVDSSAPDEFIDRGLGARDPTYRGVMTRGTVCSDNLSQACSEAKQSSTGGDAADLLESCGVSQPSVSALVANGVEQALVAFLGRSRNAEACTEEVNVLALGVQRSSQSRENPFYWSNPSEDGEAEVIGTTSGASPPAVVGLDDLGYVVAYPAGSKVELMWVPALQLQSPVAGFDCPGGDCDSREGFETPPLPTPVELTSLTGGADGSDAVRLSVLPLGAERLALGVSWLEGCGAPNTEARPARARIVLLDLVDGAVEVAETFAAVGLGESSTPPLLLPTATPFVVDGFERGDVVAEESSLGGFWAVTSPGGVEVRRLAAFDGALVDSGEVLTAPDDVRFALAGSGRDEFLAEERTLGDVASVRLQCD